MTTVKTEDLRIFDCVGDGDQLKVSLYGGPYNACGSVTFTITDPEELDRKYAKVWAWMEGDVRVDLVTNGTQIALVAVIGEKNDADRIG